MSDNVTPGRTKYHGPWVWVLCLVGLDYFSTLGYQPSLAFQAAGLLAPLATVVVVVATLFGMLPIYTYIASRSPHGQGSIGLLHRLVPGWRGKFVILILLGFAGTDFVLTRTFSAADAAVHLVNNPSPAWQRTLDLLFRAGDAVRPLSTHPYWQKAMGLWNRQMVATVVLLTVGFAFWAAFRHGFTRRVVQLAVAVTGAYLLLTAIVLGSGLTYLVSHPAALDGWYAKVAWGQWEIPGGPPVAGHGAGAILAVCILLFPKMALGLSGFEMTMVAMPLVRGGPGDDPARRVAASATRKRCWSRQR
jgi:hypothetical protein